MNKDILDKGFTVLDYALSHNLNLTETTEKLGLYESFPRKLRKKVEKWWKNGELNTDIYNIFNEKYNNILNINNKTKRVYSKVAEHNSDIEDSYDKRSTYWVVRDDNNKISEYSFKILVRDELPFEGKISRKEMELIFQYYPYVTRNTISQHFPYFTFPQFKRILRVFNITKDKLFPQHILEEHNEDNVAEFALKAKEASSYKKFIEQKTSFIEKQLRDTQSKLIEEQENKYWYETLINNFFTEYNQKFENKSFLKYNNTDVSLKNESQEKGYNGPTIFTIFGDIHFGKFFPTKNVMYGRGNNKDILKERCLEVIKSSVNKVNQQNSKKLVLNCLGDVFESILPDGMHPQHTFEMDLYGHEQMSWGVNVFEEMLDYFIDNTKSDVELVLHGIGGNHDRIGEKRDQDKKRTATGIFYSILRKIATYKYNDRVSIIEHNSGIIQFEESSISFIGFHGDSTLMKRKPIELMNLFKIGDNKNYTVMMNGHWHFGKFNEGVNYMQIGSGSVCSVDDFIQNEIGGGAQPSFIIGNKSNGYGFDFERITLF